MKEIFLIGLGNPGKKYSKSRHNIGFLLLENLSKKYNSNFLFKDKLKSSCSEFQINDSMFRLFLPNTFMNNSGAVSYTHLRAHETRPYLVCRLLL